MDLKMKTVFLVIKNTLQSMEIKATKENCDKAMSIYTLCDKAVEALEGLEGKQHDGNCEGENVPD